jgi:hypothetical protein
MVEYFSEREGGERARDQEAIGAPFWGALVALVSTSVGNGAYSGAS